MATISLNRRWEETVGLFGFLVIHTLTGRPPEWFAPGQVEGLFYTHCLWDKHDLALGCTEGGLGKSRGSWILWLRNKEESGTSSGRNWRGTQTTLKPSGYRGEGRGVGTEVPQSPDKAHSQQKDPFPTFDPERKLPIPPAKNVWQVHETYSKINCTESGWWHFQTSNHSRQKKGPCTTLSADVKLNPWKTAIVLLSALRFNAAMWTSAFFKDRLFKRKAATVAIERWKQQLSETLNSPQRIGSAGMIALILGTGEVHSERTSSVFPEDKVNVTGRWSLDLGAIHCGVPCLPELKGRS